MFSLKEVADSESSILVIILTEALRSVTPHTKELRSYNIDKILFNFRNALL